MARGLKMSAKVLLLSLAEHITLLLFLFAPFSFPFLSFWETAFCYFRPFWSLLEVHCILMESIPFPKAGFYYGYSFVCRYYHATINVGHPPNPYFLDIDSGSDLTWLQCDAPCTKCTPVIMVSIVLIVVVIKLLFVM